MKTENLNAKIIDLNEFETTNNLMYAAEMGDILEFTTVNGSQDRALTIQRVEYGEVGFERRSDWMRFVNKLNDYDTIPIKRAFTGDKKVSDWGEFTISRTDIDYPEDGFLIEFKEPVKLLLERIGDRAIIIEVSKLKGEFTWEWSSYRTRHEDLGNYAGVCEIYLYNVEIVN